MALPWALDSETTEALPVDALALLVLDNYRQADGWNYCNWLVEQQQYSGLRKEALDACAEAWQWLLGHALVAPTPGQSSPHAVFITRAGYAALEEGTERVRAAERLGLDLHPSIRQSVERQFILGEYELGAFAAM